MAEGLEISSDIENDLIDVHELLGEVDDENWLVASEGSGDGLFGLHPSDKDLITIQSKKSLVKKLDNIAKVAPYMSPISSVSSGSRSSNLSPGMSSYLRQNLSSTPISASRAPQSRFDPRTFTRPKMSIDSALSNPHDISGNQNNLSEMTFVDQSTPKQPPTASPIRQLNMTFDRRRSSNTPPKSNVSFEKASLNATFDKHSATYGLNEESTNNSATRNRTFEVNSSSPPAINSTFNRRKLSDGPTTNHDRRFSRDSSHDLLEDDRLSTNSESSVSHRLNDVGDVQQLARMQEESLRQPVMTNYRSATISPSSEQSLHSPSTEGFSIGNNGQDYPSEEGSAELYRQHKQRNSTYQQYSSQDSLPDSPYSSQSLDSQSTQGQDRLRRSMPNLNKIRGRGGASARGRGSGESAAVVASGIQRPPAYGLSRQHNSDPRLQAANGTSRIGGAGRGYYGGRASYAGQPSRGSVVNEQANQREVEHSSRNSTFRVPTNSQPKLSTGTRIARPVGCGIPRPGGSRLPGPTRSGIPKPSSSQPGSRASSVGPRRPANNDNYYR